MFYFHPCFGKFFQFDHHIFSMGLTPPTSGVFKRIHQNGCYISFGMLTCVMTTIQVSIL